MSRLARLNELKKLVSVIYSNAEKSTNRPYTLETIDNKRRELNEYLQESRSISFTDDDPHDYVQTCISTQIAVFNIVSNALVLLNRFQGTHRPTVSVEELGDCFANLRATEPNPTNTHTDNDPPTENDVNILVDVTNPSENNEVTMSNFNFETGLKLPVLNADCDAVIIRDFIDTVESYHDTLSAAGKTALLAFVVKNRVQGNAKTRLGQSNITTFAELKRELLGKLGVAETKESLHAKLSGLRQGRMSLTDYAETLELTALKLATLQIQELNIDTDVGRTTVQDTLAKHALFTFKRGLHNELKTVVEAAQPASLAAALAIATSANINSPAPTFYHRPNFRGGRGRGRGTFRGRGRGHYRSAEGSSSDQPSEPSGSGTPASTFRGRGRRNNYRRHNNQPKN